jgi:class 3 adenylate cyclase/tetratricopeptide (TPR) repeat protein
VATTEHITVVFTDLVGSTELQSALSPEAADDVRNKHFSALREAIATSGGTEVKNLGDGLMVVFPAASSALICAVAMQQAVHRDNVGAERRLGIRVGLSSGEATKEGDDYFGDPVIEAARLCAKADGGQILATDVVKVNAGRRSVHAFTPMGALELKGLPEPVETLEVPWQPLDDDMLAAGRVPLPVRLGHAPGVGVIGREDELATLDAAAKRVAAGEGRELFFIAGEPGQGKTTLVSEFARRAQRNGMTVLLGRCDEDVGAPYRPFHEALSHLVANADETLLRAHLEIHGGELDRMVPALRQRLGEVPAPQSTDADTERYLLYAAVTGLLEQTSVSTPVVLVLDDLHWADKPSLQLLRHLVAHSATQRLLIIGTYRDAELSSTHQLEEALAALHREPAGISAISVKGLNDTGVIEFMEAAAGHRLDDAGVSLAHQLYRETDGNPFFVSEVLRHLSESGAIVQDPATGRWIAAEEEQLTLPHSVRSVIGTRVARLGDEATKVLAAASVIGRDFDVEVLAETTQVGEDALLDLLEDAERAAVVHEVDGPPGRYSFSHALIQHTLYDDLSTTRRTRIHRQVGEAIERLYPNDPDEYIGELARHFFLATRPSDTTKAIAYAKRAGDAALSALAPDDAVRYFSQALELAPQDSGLEPTLRIDLLIGLGTSQRQAGFAEFRETLLEAAQIAQRVGDTERLVTAALANNRGWFSSLGVVDTDRVEVLEFALEALPETDSPHRARVLSRLCNELAFGPSERRLELGREATAVALRIGDEPTLVEVVADLGNPLRMPTTLDENLGYLREAIRLADLLDDPFTQCLLAGQAAADGFRSADFDLAARSLTRMTEIAERLRLPAQLWAAAFQDAGAALVHGDPTRAEELAEKALEIGTASGQPDALSFYGTQLMEIRHQQGRMGELADLIAQLAEENPSIPTFRAVLASVELEAGNARSAREVTEEGAARSFDLPMDVAWLDGIVNYAQPAIELGMEEAATQLLELLRPFHGQVPFQGLVPHEPVAMFVGGLATVLGRYEEAETYFEEADELNRRGEMRFAEANTKMLWGRMLRQRGEPGDAERSRELLEQSGESAASRGYAMVERRANAELSVQAR